MMADIAYLFKWSLSDLKNMDLLELADWHTKAIERLKLSQ